MAELGARTESLERALDPARLAGGSVGDFFAIPFIGVGLLLVLQPAFPSTVLTAALPIIGPALLVRDMHTTLTFYRTLGFRVTGCHPSAAAPAQRSRRPMRAR